MAMGPSIIFPESSTGDVTSETNKGEAEALKDLSVLVFLFEW